MAGSKEGARKRLETIRSRPDGLNDIKRWASLGGKLSTSRAFALDKDLAKRAAFKSGEIRRAKRDAKLAESEALEAERTEKETL